MCFFTIRDDFSYWENGATFDLLQPLEQLQSQLLFLNRILLPVKKEQEAIFDLKNSFGISKCLYWIIACWIVKVRLFFDTTLFLVIHCYIAFVPFWVIVTFIHKFPFSTVDFVLSEYKIPYRCALQFCWNFKFFKWFSRSSSISPPNFQLFVRPTELNRSLNRVLTLYDDYYFTHIFILNCRFHIKIAYPLLFFFSPQGLCFF